MLKQRKNNKKQIYFFVQLYMCTRNKEGESILKSKNKLFRNTTDIFKKNGWNFCYCFIQQQRWEHVKDKFRSA